VTALDRWRERCRRHFAVASDDTIPGLQYALAIEEEWSVEQPGSELDEELVNAASEAIGSDERCYPGLSLALRWLREEIERGDDHE
jgi:hypothetical protein